MKTTFVPGQVYEATTGPNYSMFVLKVLTYELNGATLELLGEDGVIARGIYVPLQRGDDYLWRQIT